MIRVQYARIAASFALTFLAATNSFAQENDCASTYSTLPCDLLRYSTLVDPSTLPTVRIPVVMHIVRRSDGSGGFRGNLQTIEQTLTDKFVDAGMEFFIQSIQTHDNSSFSDPPWDNLKEDALCATYNVPGVVNMYFVPDYGDRGGTGTFTPDVMAMMPPDEIRYYQGIIMSNENGLHTTPYHEMGHYFNLLHTFETSCGTDERCGGSTYTGGDLVIDTAPDKESFLYSGCDCIDENQCVGWCPPTMNLMSYAFDCRNLFSDWQLIRARTTFELKRPELHYLFGKFTNMIENSNAGGTFLIDGSSVVPSGEYISFANQGSHSAQTQNERFLNFIGNTDYKHHHWEGLLTDHLLLHSFELQNPAELYDKSALFTPMEPVTIKNEIIDVPASSPNQGQIKFHDPWYMLADGSQPNIFIEFSSPLYPRGAENQSEGGIFKDQEILPSNRYYSVEAKTSPIAGFTATFYGWESSGANVISPTQYVSPVVFQQSNAVVRAKYKLHRASSVSTATASNSQRKLAGYDYLSLSLGYPSAGEIWLTETTDGGGTWSVPEYRVSAGTGGFSDPSLAIRDDVLPLNTSGTELYVIYQENQGSTNRVVLSRRRGSTWYNPLQINTTSVGTGSAHPVVSTTNTEWQAGQGWTRPTLIALWDAGSGLRRRVARLNSQGRGVSQCSMVNGQWSIVKRRVFRAVCGNGCERERQALESEQVTPHQVMI
jgi:hypothetical protein